MRLLLSLFALPYLPGFAAYLKDYDHVATPRKFLQRNENGESHQARQVSCTNNVGENINLNDQTSMHPIRSSLEKQHGTNCYRQVKQRMCKRATTDFAVVCPRCARSSRVSRRQSRFYSRFDTREVRDCQIVFEHCTRTPEKAYRQAENPIVLF